MKPTTNKKRKTNDSTTILPPAKRAKKRPEPPLPPISEEDETIEILDFRIGTYNPSSKRALLVSSKLVLRILLLDESDDWVSMEIRFGDVKRSVSNDANEETCAICPESAARKRLSTSFLSAAESCPSIGPSLRASSGSASFQAKSFVTCLAGTGRAYARSIATRNSSFARLSGEPRVYIRATD